MGNRRKARELALHLLFQEDITHYTPEEIREIFWTSNAADAETREYADLIFTQAIENRSDIDALIRSHSQHWRLERMAVVDRNILRLAICEFLHTETPRVVIIDEAIEVARKYSGDESTEFINGVLDAVKRDIENDRENRTGESEDR
ncbi:MAG: transcription antitermination factor NusB [Acidobacteriota bacterium]